MSEQDHTHTVYRELLKISDRPNAIKMINSKALRRAAENRLDIIEKVWILSLEKTIEQFANAISDETETLYYAQKWDKYFAKKHGVNKKKPPRAKIYQPKSAAGRVTKRADKEIWEESEKTAIDLIIDEIMK